MWGYLQVTGELKSGVKYSCIPEEEYNKLQAENKRLKEEIDEAITLIDEGDEGTARETLFQALQEKK